MDDCREIVKMTIEQFGGLDVIISNAVSIPLASASES